MKEIKVTSTDTQAQDAYHLNQGQKDAADGFFQFLFSAEKEIIISGPGGVGKTYLMRYIIDTTMQRYFDACKLMGVQPKYDSVDMTAMTNKAAAVLALATKRPADTIHSFLNLKVKENYRTGETDLIRTNRWEPHENKIIFIDECSMIDRKLYQQIMESTPNCKLVYVGDHCQLTPVQESISPIYNQRIKMLELTEPMRNAGQPALMNICNQLRQTVETGKFTPIKIVPGVIDLLDDSSMAQFLQVAFKEQTSEARVLAYTNRRVIQYNDHIRIDRQLPDEYTVGELLVNNSSLQLKNGNLPVEQDVEIIALSDKVEKITIDAGADAVELEVRKATLTTPLGGVMTDIQIPVDRDHHHALIKHYQRKKDWERYFRLKNEFPDLRQRDASTVYKAQGSTYEIVFIDLSNISTCHNPDQVARMLYVAFSRARSRILLYGELASKYGGLIH